MSFNLKDFPHMILNVENLWYMSARHITLFIRYYSKSNG